MEIVKDLNPELRKQEAKDRFYLVAANLRTLLAPQDPETTRLYQYKKTGWGKIVRVEATTDGSPTAETAPRRKRKTRSGEGETKETGCWSFKSDGNGGLLLPWAGSFGLLKSGLRRTLAAKNKLKYDNPGLDLIKVYPKRLQIAGPIDSLQDGSLPEVVLTNRNTQRGTVMVEEFFDYIKNRTAKFILRVDSEATINEEKFIGVLKSISNLDNFGPSKRGEIEIKEVQEVKLSPEEVENLRNDILPEELRNI